MLSDDILKLVKQVERRAQSIKTDLGGSKIGYMGELKQLRQYEGQEKLDCGRVMEMGFVLNELGKLYLKARKNEKKAKPNNVLPRV